MENLVGKNIIISGMNIEIISEDDTSFECRNITTNETIFMKKEAVVKAIKLGKAEIIS